MTTRPAPPTGLYLQLYRGAIRGATPEARRAQLARYLDQITAWGYPGVVFHGFPRELLAAWPRLAAMAHDRGLHALASWGLDSAKDNDGTRLTVHEKGDLVGQVLADASCVAGLLDAEGQWDSDLGPADDMDEAGALALCAAIQARAPGAWVGDQPWYAIDSHGDVRRPARPIEHGGAFRGFPVDEFARVTTWGRYRQAYIYNQRGGFYRPTFERMDREWARVAPALAAAGLERPLRCTLQAYGWKLHELVHALLDRHVRTGDPLILWCDPWPDAVCRRALAVVRWMIAEGFAVGGCDPVRAVKDVQIELNRKGYALDVDGACGDLTADAMGVAREF